MSQPDTPEQPDTESQKTAVPQPEMQPETSSETPPEPQEPAQWQPEKHRFSSIGILAASAIGVVLALYAFRLPPFGMGEVYTNNAYVRGSVTAVSPRVGGYVQKVLVRDFDNVKAGQPLVEIDPAPYRAKVAQAKAGLAGQQAALNKTAQDKASAIAVSKANQAAIDNARAQLDRARREWQRIQAVSADAVSQSSRDAAQTAVKQAEAGLKQAQEQYAVAQQNIINTGVGREGAQAGIANAQALLDLAKQDLGHTTIYAPRRSHRKTRAACERGHAADVRRAARTLDHRQHQRNRYGQRENRAECQREYRRTRRQGVQRQSRRNLARHRFRIQPD